MRTPGRLRLGERVLRPLADQRRSNWAKVVDTGLEVSTPVSMATTPQPRPGNRSIRAAKSRERPGQAVQLGDHQGVGHRASSAYGATQDPSTERPFGSVVGAVQMPLAENRSGHLRPRRGVSQIRRSSWRRLRSHPDSLQEALLRPATER